MAESFRDLEVYQESFELVKRVFRLAERLPDSQRYILSSQLQRAALSVPLNIAEGFGRQKSRRDFGNFLGTAIGSANEVFVLVDLAVGYVSETNAGKLRDDYERLARRLGALRRSVRQGSEE